MNLNNSIIKIITYTIDYNWYNPYKISDDNKSTGTGFFISNNYILTCAHVIDKATNIVFTLPLSGKKTYEAEIIGICYDKDIAILKPKNYNSKFYLEIDNSDNVKEGDIVTAVGYPLSQDNPKSTKGIISGRHGTFIQTDAPINPGNSGGCLLNDKNKVIAINSAKISSKIAENIGFCIPINDYKIIEQDLKNKKKLIINKPNLVTDFTNTTEELLKYLNLNSIDGYVIRKIYKTSPFYKSRIEKGDILCYFDNYKIDSYGECLPEWSQYKIHINNLLDRYSIGSSINIKFISVKNNLELISDKITFEDIDYYKLNMKHPPFENINYEIFGGLIFMDLTINHLINLEDSNVSIKNIINLKNYIKRRKRFKNRIILANILGESLINKNNVLKKGDIIKRINNIKVRTIEDVKKALEQPIVKNNNKYLTIKTKDSIFFIADINDLFKNEQIISKRYKYKLSDIYNKFSLNKIKYNNSNYIDKKYIIKII
jgi:hypothetical protein